MDEGLVKSIGISNFSCKKIDTLLEYARIKPVAVQVEVHPYFRNQKLMDHCKAKVSHAAGTVPCVLCRSFVSQVCCNDSIMQPTIWQSLRCVVPPCYWMQAAWAAVHAQTLKQHYHEKLQMLLASADDHQQIIQNRP